jgi:hypothetical protein
VAWVVLVPTVLSRRSIWELRGARVAAAFLAAVPLATTLILCLRPPHGGIVPLRFEYSPAFWGTMIVSLVAVVLAIRLGGRLDDIKVRRGNSRGEMLH